MMEAPGDTAGRYADFLGALQPAAGISTQK
jgi:hypothetical protein